MVAFDLSESEGVLSLIFAYMQSSLRSKCWDDYQFHSRHVLYQSTAEGLRKNFHFISKTELQKCVAYLLCSRLLKFIEYFIFVSTSRNLFLVQSYLGAQKRACILIVLSMHYYHLCLTSDDACAQKRETASKVIPFL